MEEYFAFGNQIGLLKSLIFVTSVVLVTVSLQYSLGTKSHSGKEFLRDFCAA